MVEGWDSPDEALGWICENGLDTVFYVRMSMNPW